MGAEAYNRVLVMCRAKALGAPAPDLIAVRDRAFHAELMAENAARYMARQLARLQQRPLGRVIIPQAAPPVQFQPPKPQPARPGAKGRRKR